MYTVCKSLLIAAISSLVLACGGGSGVVISALPAMTEDTDSATVLLESEFSTDPAQATTVAAVASDDSAGDPVSAEAADSESGLESTTETGLAGSNQSDQAESEVREQGAKITPADITDLILVTGQSNALGAESAYDVVLDVPHEQVFAFTDQGWQQADLHQVWDLDHFPRGNPGEEPNNNLALHMAKEIARQRGDRVVGFVLATAPGQSITHWDPSESFFQQIDSKVLEAINQLPHKSQLDGILWHQGESDEGDPDYHLKLDSLIENFRVQNWFSSDRPFICGETAVFEVVNRQLSALNGNGDRWSGCVGSENLQTHLDGFHFNAEGLRELGKRYAVKYLDMLAN